MTDSETMQQQRYTPGGTNARLAPPTIGGSLSHQSALFNAMNAPTTAAAAASLIGLGAASGFPQPPSPWLSSTILHQHSLALAGLSAPSPATTTPTTSANHNNDKLALLQAAQQQHQQQLAPSVFPSPAPQPPTQPPQMMPIIVSTVGPGHRPSLERVFIERPDGSWTPAQLVNAPPTHNSTTIPSGNTQPKQELLLPPKKRSKFIVPSPEKPPATVTLLAPRQQQQQYQHHQYLLPHQLSQASSLYHSTMSQLSGNSGATGSSEEDATTTNSDESGPMNTSSSSSSGYTVPVRPLSAYNFFFSDERDTVLKELEAVDDVEAYIASGGTTTATTGNNKSTAFLVSAYSQQELLDKRNRLLDAHQKKDRSKKRLHRKTHGKIGFTQLSKIIGQRWRALKGKEKDFYEQVADADADRYQKEINAYNHARIPASKRRKILD